MTTDREKVLQEYFKKIKEETINQMEGAIGDVYSGLLPYILDDTEGNAAYQAEEIVKQLIAGNFNFDGDYAVIEGVREYAPRIAIALNESKYNAMRDNLIKAMPKCPKDDKIAALENELKTAYQQRY